MKVTQLLTALLDLGFLNLKFFGFYSAKSVILSLFLTAEPKDTGQVDQGKVPC